MIPSSLLNWLHRELESAVSSSLEGVVFWVVRKFVDLTVVDSESGSNLKVILIADRDIAFSSLLLLGMTIKRKARENASA